MDAPFSATRWAPAEPLEPGETLPSNDDVDIMVKSLNKQTLSIRRYPYNARFWLDRARTLLQLRYPELAIGDAQKAIMLCQRLRTALQDRTEHRFGYAWGFMMIDSDDGDEGERAEERDEQRYLLDIMQQKAQDLVDANLDRYPEKGHVILRQYPWLDEKHLMRSDDIINGLNDELAENAGKNGNRPSCVVRRFAFGHGVGARNGEDTLGVFATRSISKDETIVVDKSRTWGCDGPNTTQMTDPQPGHSYYPPEDLAPDLLWIRDRTGKKAAETILKSRLLINAAQDGAEHPLDHSYIARLTPTSCTNKRKSFRVERDIQIFNEVLQQHGIDIFANLNWDTYTFFTILARVSTNSSASTHAQTLNTLFSMFNHSCESNIEWATKDYRTIVMTAKRDIECGEQLFVCYNTYMEDKSLEDRRETFRRWINGPCQCSRCLREEEQMSGSGGSTPSLTFSSSSSGWDSDDKPVLPEDIPVCEKAV